jgi:hypothetical protein
MPGKPDGKHRATKKDGPGRHAKVKKDQTESKLRKALTEEAEDATRASDNGEQR